MERNAEEKFEIAMKRISQCWKTREKEINLARAAKLEHLAQELIKLREEHNDCKRQVTLLYQDNSDLNTKIEELHIENSKLEHFKSKLLESFKEAEEIPKKVQSPRFSNIETQGREFFIQAKARLSYEVFNAFSSYVRELNEKTIEKSEALYEIRELFEEENADLFEAFSSLLEFF